MKILNLTFALLLCSVLSSPAPILIRKVSAGVSYVVNQDFEGTGYDNSETWTESGTVDEDHTTTVKVGSQSVSVGAGADTYITISDSSNYTCDFWFYRTTIPVGTRSIMGFRTSAAGAACLMRMNTSGQLAVYANGGDSAYTTDAISTSTWYRVRLIWNASGTCSIEFNTTGTFDGSGSDYTSTTGGTETIARLYLGNVNTLQPMLFDLVQVQ